MSDQLEPVEPATTIALIESEGDPELMLAVLEKKAALAERMRTAVEHILISQTYPLDWTIQGEKACLASAGAERIGRNFPIKYENVFFQREEFSDTNGKAYRYVYCGYATLYDRKCYCEGSYSTRDEFLGKKGGEWRPIEDINEGDIRSAAHHIFTGNCVKELLGIRNIPASDFARIMAGTGRDPAKSATVTRGQGTDGGTNTDDSKHQIELTEKCLAMANAHTSVVADGDDWKLVPLSESDERPAVEVAKAICITLSGFTAKDGKVVAGKLSKQLKGKWLSATLAKARKLVESLPKDEDTFTG
jgi:hypothetical protein